MSKTVCNNGGPCYDGGWVVVLAVAHVIMEDGWWC